MKTCRALCLVLLLSAGPAATAWGQSCSVAQITNSGQFLATLSSVNGGTMDGNTLVVNGQAPLGATIGSAQFQVNSASTFTVNCPSTPVVLVWRLATPDSEHVAPTGIPGVGMKVKVNGVQQMQPTFSQTFHSSPITQSDISIRSLTLDFVRTGDIDWQTKPMNTTLITGSIQQAPGFSTSVGMIGSILSIRKGAPTCNVTTPAISVAMGRINSASLDNAPNVGFDIGLRCEGGDAGITSKVYVTLTDTNYRANRTDVLTLRNDGSGNPVAQGVGIQLTNASGAVIKYGEDKKAIDPTSNQWLAGNAGNGIFNIPIRARYVKTGSTVTAGSANAQATFTINYL